MYLDLNEIWRSHSHHSDPKPMDDWPRAEDGFDTDKKMQ